MNHKHEYLLEVFDEKDIPFPFNEKDYPKFDKRDTYNLNDTIACWLYERLRFFQEHTIINLDYHKFNIDGEELTQRQCIQKMVDDCKVIMLGDIWDDESFNQMEVAKYDLFKILGEVYWAMWW